MRTVEKKRRHLPLTVLIFLLIFGLVAAINTAYLVGLAVLDNAVRRATVTEGSLALALEGQALLLRREAVLVAPATGTWQAMVEDGQRVRAGQKLGEVLDPALLTQARAVQAEVKAERAVWESDLRASLSRLETELAEVTQQIQATLAELRAGLVNPSDPGHSQRMEAALKKLVERRNGYLAEQARLREEAESGGPWGEKSQEAERLFSAASVPVTSPVAGVVFYTLDGWEDAFDPVQYQAALTLSAPTGATLAEPVTAGERVAAGQLLAKVVQDERTFLRLSVTTAKAALLKPGERVEVLLLEQGAYVPARVAALGQEEAATTLLLELLSSPPFMASERTTQVEVVAKRLYGNLVPEEALVESGGQTGVYLMSGGRWVFRAVEVTARQEGQALVKGLKSGDEVAVGWRP